MPVFKTSFTASRFITGKTPGWPRQMGQTFILGCFSSGSFKQPQNILVFVFNSTCISKPFGWSVFHGPRLVDFYHAAVQVFSVPHRNSFFSFLVRRHFHKTETARP